jgi:hypothetical protein
MVPPPTGVARAGGRRPRSWSTLIPGPHVSETSWRRAPATRACSSSAASAKAPPVGCSPERSPPRSPGRRAVPSPSFAGRSRTRRLRATARRRRYRRQCGGHGRFGCCRGHRRCADSAPPGGARVVRPDRRTAGGAHRVDEDWDTLAASAETLLREAAARVAQRAPHVEVETRALRDTPLRALLDLAGTARLVVVGPRSDHHVPRREDRGRRSGRCGRHPAVARAAARAAGSRSEFVAGSGCGDARRASSTHSPRPRP